MNPRLIFLPVCAQVLLTFIVLGYMFITRVRAIKKNCRHLQEMADQNREAEILKAVVNPSDNLENLFEFPVIFFVVVIAIFVTGLVDSTYVIAAWLYVASRAVHSYIHCTYNQVDQRFAAYAISTAILIFICIHFAIQII
jgi:hypothetical protein